jgi:hypothetical protein
MDSGADCDPMEGETVSCRASRLAVSEDGCEGECKPWPGGSGVGGIHAGGGRSAGAGNMDEAARHDADEAARHDADDEEGAVLGLGAMVVSNKRSSSASAPLAPMASSR